MATSSIFLHGKQTMKSTRKYLDHEIMVICILYISSLSNFPTINSYYFKIKKLYFKIKYNSVKTNEK